MKISSIAGTLLMCLVAPVHASWTIAVLPDSQHYNQFPELASIFEGQAQWIVDNKEAYGIEMVLHTGDITNNNFPVQWARAKNAMSILDEQLPYTLALGNHDYTTAPTGFDEELHRHLPLVNDYFSVSDNSLNSGTIEMVPGDLANTYRTFTAPDGRKMLILQLEFLPRPEVQTWAGNIANMYPDHTAIVLAHANLREGPPDAQGEPTSTREPVGHQLWNSFNSQYENIELVLSGHHHTDFGDTDPYGPMTTARLVSVGVNGNIVNEVGFDTQDQPNGGNGYMRLYEFLDDGKTVQVRTYSPFLDVWLTNSRNEFQISLTQIYSPADFNEDGNVDASDLLLWNQNFGQTAGALQGDADEDGDIDSADFLAWQQRFNPATQSSSTIPEPTSIALTLLAMAICGATSVNPRRYRIVS